MSADNLSGRTFTFASAVWQVCATENFDRIFETNRASHGYMRHIGLFTDGYASFLVLILAMIRACFNGEKTSPNTRIRMNAISWYKTAHNLNIVKRYLQTKPGQFVKRTRTIRPPALYFHRTVFLLCTPTRGTDLKFFNIKIMKF